MVIGMSAPLAAQEAGPAPTLGSEGLPGGPEIEVWAKYWIDKIATADTEAEIVEARQRLISGYERFEPAAYRYDYAEVAATRVSAMLKALVADDDLKTLREINAASVVGAFDQVSVQWTLGELIAHDNPGVRYWGWKGFGRIRDLSLAQGGQTAQAFFTALTQRSAAETSAVVLGAMWETMVLSASRPDGIDTATWAQAIDKFTGILDTHWAAACEQIATGDSSWVGAAPRAILAMTRLARMGGEEELSAPLSHLLHMTFAAFRAYDGAPDGSELEQRATVLLVSCEAALSGLTGLSGDPGIEETVTNPSFPNKQAQNTAAGLAVDQWKSLLIAQYAVQPPPISLVGADADDEADEGEGDADDDSLPPEMITPSA
jgi:hypothetical protein